MEKNKAWLLPLLGVGVVGVLYLNLHTSAAPPAPPAPAPEAVPAEAAAPEAAPEAVSAEENLWSDLQALSRPPLALAEEGALRERSRENLDALLEPSPAMRLPKPGRVREAELPRPEALPVASALPAPVPAVEFILSGPEGLQAWFQGRPYRKGQTLAGGQYTLGPLLWNRVALVDRQGKTTYQFTHSSTRPVGGVRPSVEAP